MPVSVSYPGARLSTSLTQGGSSTGTILGTVVDGSAVPVPGGTIELLNSTGSSVTATTTADGSGNYAFSGITAGTQVRVRNQPKLAYSIGPSEPDYYAITVAAGSNPQNFVVQPAAGSENFSRFDTIAHLLGFCQYNGTTGDPTNATWPIPSTGLFFGWNGGTEVDGTAASGPTTGGVPNTNYLSLANAGPSGEQVLRYTQPSRPNSGISANFSVEVDASLNPVKTAFTSEFWLRRTFKLSTGWKVGGDEYTASSCEYKWGFINIVQGGHSGAIELLWQNNHAGAPVAGDTNFRIILNDSFSGTTDQSVGILTGFDGAFHTIVIGVTGINTANVTVSVYIDGALLGSITGPFFPNATWFNRVQHQFGANINNGPTNAQTIDHAEFGIYYSRPSLRSGYAV